MVKSKQLVEPLTTEQLEILKENDTFKNLFDLLQDMGIRLARMETLLDGKVNKTIQNSIKDKIDTLLKEHQI